MEGLVDITTGGGERGVAESGIHERIRWEGGSSLRSPAFVQKY